MLQKTYFIGALSCMVTSMVLLPSVSNADVLTMLFGYQSYEECVIGELSQFANPSGLAMKTVKDKCRDDFPLPDGATQWREMWSGSITCHRGSDPDICEKMDVEFQNTLDYPIDTINGKISKLRGGVCGSENIDGTVYNSSIDPVNPGEKGVVTLWKSIKDRGNQNNFCVRVFGKIRD